MQCPRCGQSLKAETYETVVIDRCGGCKGCWLDEGELGHVIESREQQFSKELIQQSLATEFKSLPLDEQRSVESCPKCRKAMQAVNYNHSSGVIFDRCPDGHGLWLDGSELERIQIYREHWEQKETRLQADWAALARSVVDDRSGAADEERKRSMRPTRYFVNSLIRKLLGG